MMTDFHRTMQYPTEHGEISIAWHMALRNDHNVHVLNQRVGLKHVGKRYRPYRDAASKTWGFYTDWSLSISRLREN